MKNAAQKEYFVARDKDGGWIRYDGNYNQHNRHGSRDGQEKVWTRRSAGFDNLWDGFAMQPITAAQAFDLVRCHSAGRKLFVAQVKENNRWRTISSRLSFWQIVAWMREQGIHNGKQPVNNARVWIA